MGMIQGAITNLVNTGIAAGAAKSLKRSQDTTNYIAAVNSAANLDEEIVKLTSRLENKDVQKSLEAQQAVKNKIEARKLQREMYLKTIEKFKGGK